MPPNAVRIITGTAGRTGNKFSEVNVDILNLPLHPTKYDFRNIIHMLTKADQNPYIGLWGRSENSVDQPEGVENFYAHPSEGAEKGIVEACRHPGAHTVPSYVGQDPSEEEEQTEEGERHSQAQVDVCRQLLKPSGRGRMEWK